MKNFLNIAFVLSLAVLIQSCYTDVGPLEGDGGSIDSTDPIVDVSYAAQVQPIFDSHCVSCHGMSGNLSLSAANSYANLVGAYASGYTGILVVPGDAESSILYKKIDGSGAYGINMPLGGSLTATQINTIKQWIDEGAANN